MMATSHFNFEFEGPVELHRWLSSIAPYIELEIAETLDELRDASLSELEHIVVYLHYMYTARFVLPTLEAVLGREATAERPDIVRHQLLACLMGRFVDDLIDKDSGFWNEKQALYFFSHFQMRCDRVRPRLGLGEGAERRWLAALRFNLLDDGRLYDASPDRYDMRPRAKCAWPYIDYWKRVKYFFWALREVSTDEIRLQWAMEYVSALFYNYDVDDALNDILRNVPTEPAFVLVHGMKDDEGRLKLKGHHFTRELSSLEDAARMRLTDCQERGQRLGLLLGPAMLAKELIAVS
ncbi:MAG: hypothetical protein Q8O14_12955 [bacterium]|nr:hypothetical protein [bacterium]